MKGIRRFEILLMALLVLLGVGNQMSMQGYGGSAPQWDESPVPGETPEIQRQHAAIFSEFRTGKKLHVLAATGTGPLVVRVGSYPGYMVGVSSQRSSTYPHGYLITIAGMSDAVVVGTVKAKTTALTGNGEFLFSDFQMTVDDVLKDNPEKPIKPKSDIIVTRPGGTLEIDSRTVYAITIGFKPFQISSRYVLFLKYLPATGAYRAFGERSFRLLQTGVSVLTPSRPYQDLQSERDPTAFLQEVRDAAITRP